MIICTKEVSVGARKNAYTLLVEIGNAFIRFCGDAKGKDYSTRGFGLHAPLDFYCQLLPVFLSLSLRRSLGAVPTVGVRGADRLCHYDHMYGPGSHQTGL